jgi:hypothetical protein
LIFFNKQWERTVKKYGYRKFLAKMFVFQHGRTQRFYLPLPVGRHGEHKVKTDNI